MVLYNVIMSKLLRFTFVGLVPQMHQRMNSAQALRSVGEPIFGQSIKDISGGNLLAQLFEITEKFNMATQPPLLLLQKTMVVVEESLENYTRKQIFGKYLNLFWKIGLKT